MTMFSVFPNWTLCRNSTGVHALAHVLHPCFLNPHEFLAFPSCEADVAFWELIRQCSVFQPVWYGMPWDMRHCAKLMKWWFCLMIISDRDVYSVTYDLLWCALMHLWCWEPHPFHTSWLYPTPKCLWESIYWYGKIKVADSTKELNYYSNIMQNEQIFILGSAGHYCK